MHGRKESTEGAPLAALQRQGYGYTPLLPAPTARH